MDNSNHLADNRYNMAINSNNRHNRKIQEVKMVYGRYLLMKKTDWDERGYSTVTYYRESLRQVKAIEKRYKEIDPRAETIIYSQEWEEDNSESWNRIYTNEKGKWIKSKKIKLFDPEIRAIKMDYTHAYQKKYLKWANETSAEWTDEDICPEAWIHRGGEITEQNFILWMYRNGYLEETK